MTPCKHCGAPIEQRQGRGRPKSYCPEGDCQAAAKRERELRRATPGLEGALARAEQLYDRMESGLASAIEPLARALAEELSPAGVEARLSAVQAEAHTRVAIARTEREQAFEQVRLAREAAEHARREAGAMRLRVEEAEGERDTALRDAERAREQALAALWEAASTERQALQSVEEAGRRADLAERRAEEGMAQERARADVVAGERDRLQGDLRLERARLEDVRAQLDASRAESAELRERAVAAELKAR
ncbi:hypothetical protein [Nonomuraea cavernae]|uniref:hypothetical protein n=1 Tax=Nonomuraea cavernae TaxID=2045107 RepID=UPI0033DEB04A